MSEKALIIIDMQKGMFTENLLSTMHEGKALLTNTSLLIDVARKSKLTIIYIQHCAYPGQVLIKGTDAWAIQEEIAPADSDTIVEKIESNAFEGTELASILRKKNIDTVITCGLQSEYCVANTSLAALEHGFKVIVAQDCHSTFPTEELAAEDIVKQQNNALKHKGVNVLSVLELTEMIFIEHG
jgi:nicotinamidase-related amidase